MALTGFIPAIAASAGLLTLDETSPVRQEYWPWLPIVALVLGVLYSTVFWLYVVPRRDRAADEKTLRDKSVGDKRD